MSGGMGGLNFGQVGRNIAQGVGNMQNRALQDMASQRILLKPQGQGKAANQMYKQAMAMRAANPGMIGGGRNVPMQTPIAAAPLDVNALLARFGGMQAPVQTPAQISLAQLLGG